MVCFCGRTVYEPPIPCGTLMHCTHPCPRPPPPCGHTRTPHACHEDPSPCPPCVHLTDKQCACGKKTVPNVRCSLETEKVSCGTVCGKLLRCGFHHCQRSCHADDCGRCTATCGKLRKLWYVQKHLYLGMCFDIVLLVSQITTPVLFLATLPLAAPNQTHVQHS